MKLTNTKRRTSIIVAAAAALILSARLAYAYWTATGTGSGAATTGTSATFQVDSSAPTDGPLTPGGPAQTVAFTVTNPGTGSQNLSSVVVTVAKDDGTAWTTVAGCSSSDYTLGTPAVTYGQIAPAGTVSGTVSITMNNLGTNQDACKLAVVPAVHRGQLIRLRPAGGVDASAPPASTANCPVETRTESQVGGMGHSGMSPGTSARSPWTTWRRSGRALVVLGALVTIILAAGSPASAYWMSGGVGSGTSTTGTLAPPTAVSVATTSVSPVGVGWTASTGAVTPTGYYLTRTSGGITVAACSSSPTTLVPGTSCSDSGVPEGTYSYRVIAVYRSWQSASAASGSVTVVIAAKVAVTTPPSTVTATSAISPAVAVTVQTAAGAPVTTAGISVSLAISTNPGGGTLSGTATAPTNSSGVATFANLSINTAGVGYRLTATSAGLTSATSTAFTVSTGPAAALAFTTSPTASFAGRSFYDQPVVRVVDTGGNPVTTSTATVTLTLTTSAGATLTCPARTAVAGVATFTGCSVNNPGTYTLTAASGALTTGLSASFTVVAAPTRLAWSGPTTTICTVSGGTLFALTYDNCTIFFTPVPSPHKSP